MLQPPRVRIGGRQLYCFIGLLYRIDRVLRLNGMKTDAGIGLRIGISRYDSALIRIDFAYAFNSSPLNRPGRVISMR